MISPNFTHFLEAAEKGAWVVGIGIFYSYYYCGYKKVYTVLLKCQVSEI